MIVTEFVKHAHNRGEAPDLHFFRDSNGREVDLVVGQGMPPGQLGLVEIKAGMTVQQSWFRPIDDVCAALGPDRIGRRMLIHGGGDCLVRRGVEVVGLAA